MGGDGAIGGCIKVEVGWQSEAAAVVTWSVGVEDVEEKVPRLEADHDVLWVWRCGMGDWTNVLTS